jgi:hypothetical protein
MPDLTRKNYPHEFLMFVQQRWALTHMGHVFSIEMLRKWVWFVLYMPSPKSWSMIILNAFVTIYLEILHLQSIPILLAKTRITVHKRTNFLCAILDLLFGHRTFGHRLDLRERSQGLDYPGWRLFYQLYMKFKRKLLHVLLSSTNLHDGRHSFNGLCASRTPC